MLRTLDTNLFLVGLLTCCILVGGVAVGGELDPQQKVWIKKYETQENAPKPEEMLLNTDAEPDLTEGFIPLCNGKDLTGWVSKGGECTFEVKEGAIVGTCVPGTDSTYLCTEKTDYTDFVFTCEVKWEVDGNSGIQIRSKSKPDDSNSVFGPQIEMEGKGKGNRNWSGGVYCQSCGGYYYPLWLKEHREARAALKPEEWNRVTVSAKGNVIKTWINGVPVSHWVDDGTYASGFFALQVHSGSKGTIVFKNIRVKELNK